MSGEITALSFADFVERAAEKYYADAIDCDLDLWVRRVSAAEFHEVFKAHYQTGFDQPYENLFESGPAEFTKAKQMEFCRRHMERQLIMQEGELIGWGTGDLLDPETYYLRNGCIFPRYRKHGIMRAYLKHKISFLEEIGYELITAAHESHNAPIIKLFLSLGFFIGGLEYDDRFGFMVRTIYIINQSRREKAHLRLGLISENKNQQNKQLMLRPYDHVKLIKALDEKYQINGYCMTSEGSWVCLQHL